MIAMVLLFFPLHQVYSKQYWKMKKSTIYYKTGITVKTVLKSINSVKFLLRTGTTDTAILILIAYSCFQKVALHKCHWTDSKTFFHTSSSVTSQLTVYCYTASKGEMLSNPITQHILMQFQHFTGFQACVPPLPPHPEKWKEIQILSKLPFTFQGVELEMGDMLLNNILWLITLKHTSNVQNKYYSLECYLFVNYYLPD